MEKLDYSILEQGSADVLAKAKEAKELREYNIKQNYLRAVSRLCDSEILSDWVELNKVVDFKNIKTAEYWDNKVGHWVQLIDKYVKQNGKLSQDSGDLVMAFNPQTTWIHADGGFGAYRAWGGCGDTNMLYFKPEDVDTVNHAITWHEYKGTKSNEVQRDGSWFGDAYELKTVLLNELIGNYERYRKYAFDKTLEIINKLKAQADQAKADAAAILVEDYD